MLKFEVNNQKGSLKIKPLLKRLEKFFKKDFKKPTVVSLAIVDKKISKKLNQKYRGKREATDILTFVYEEKDATGEIVLCYDKIKERAKKEDGTVLGVAARLIVHGLFHILGYTHKEDRAALKMEQKEGAALKRISAIMALKITSFDCSKCKHLSKSR